MAENVPAVVVPALPDHLKQFQTSEVPTDAESMAASSNSIPRISLKAKVFRYVVGGEEVLRSPGKTSFVILAVDPVPGRFIKTYYAGAFTGDSTPPTCASQDGVRPDPWSEAIQSDLCATCPQNRFGSATSRTGKKTKACRDSKRLWIADPKDIVGTVYALGIPVTSLKALSALGRQFSELNVPISTAVVEAVMDEEESYPILTFNIIGWLDANAAAEAIKRNTARDWDGGTRTDNPASTAIASRAQAPALANPQVPESTAKSGDVNQAIKNW